MNTKSLRFRLTAWYAGLLAGALLVFGVSIYLGLERYLTSELQRRSGFPGKSLKLMRQRSMDTFFVLAEPTAAPYMFREHPKTTVSILRLFHCPWKSGKRNIRDK